MEESEEGKVCIDKDLKVSKVEGPLRGYTPPILKQVGRLPGATNAVFRLRRGCKRQPWQMRPE